MALLSVPLNYFITYPVYAKLFGGMDLIIAAYQAILPSVKSLIECLVIFNMPFTFVKGLLDVVLCFLIYKPLSPLLHK
jgi:riboflavin transporter FmnP